jgi:hypothetical protein
VAEVLPAGLDRKEDDMMVRGPGAGRGRAGGLHIERHNWGDRQRCYNAPKRKGGGSTANGQDILPKLSADVMRLGGGVWIFLKTAEQVTNGVRGGG